MKKALTFISAVAFASASESDNELRIRPVSYNPNEDFPLEDFIQTFPRKFPRDLPPILYADDDELRIRPVSYNPNEDFPIEDFIQTFPRKFPRDLPPLVYVDDAEDSEQFANFNIVQNWHYPLKPLPVTQPFVPFKPVSVENQPKIEEESIENVLYQLGQVIKQGVEVKNREHETATKPALRPESRVFMPPSSIKREYQETRN